MKIIQINKTPGTLCIILLEQCHNILESISARFSKFPARKNTNLTGCLFLKTPTRRDIDKYKLFLTFSLTTYARWGCRLDSVHCNFSFNNE